MAVTMIVQMRMTPQAGERSQRIIMNLMPLMFFLFCYNFASALALYWTTQNLISIGQTALIRRLPMPVLSAAKKKKPGFFQRMMDQQRVALEEQQRKAKGRNMRNITPKSRGRAFTFSLPCKCGCSHGRTFYWGRMMESMTSAGRKGKFHTAPPSKKPDSSTQEKPGFPRHIFFV